MSELDPAWFTALERGHGALYVGVDPARGDDLTAIAMVERVADGTIVRAVKFGPWDTRDVERVIDNMTRDRMRPSGYSQSHWRKIWRARRG